MQLIKLKSLFPLTLIGYLCLFSGCFGESNANNDGGQDRLNTDMGPYVPLSTFPKKEIIKFELLNASNPLEITKDVLNNFYNSLILTETFRQELEITENSQVNYKFSPRLVNDVNNDGVEDVIFLVEKDIQDKKEFIRYYILAFNNGEELIPIEYFYAGGGESELLFEFNQITDSQIVKGFMKPNYFVKSKDVFPIEYIFDGKELVKK